MTKINTIIFLPSIQPSKTPSHPKIHSHNLFVKIQSVCTQLPITKS